MKINLITTWIFFGFSFFTQAALAAVGSDTYTLTPSNNSNINITSTQTNLQVASLEAVDNSSSTQRTYTVSVTSQNGGLLNSTAKTNSGSAATYLKTYKIGFSMSTGSNLSPATPLLDTATIGTTPTTLFSAKESSATVGVTGNITFSITGTSASQLYSGTYSDVVTVTFTRSGGTTQSITLNLTAAVISDAVTLSITPTASASNLPLTSTQSNLNVGSISVIANCQNGYIIQVSSSNSGSLANTNKTPPLGANDKIAYTMSFGGSNLTLSSTPTTFKTVNTATMYTSATSLGNLLMSYTGVSTNSRSAGTYQDVLTFTLQAQ